VRVAFAGLRSVGQSLASSWSAFFFTPQPATPVALYRILYGLLVIANLAQLHRDWLTWFGARGLVGVDTLRQLTPRLDLDWIWLPLYDDRWMQAFFWVFLLFAVFLTVGFMSRFSSVLVFLFLNVIIRRNFYITNGGDFLLRVMGFFLMFAPAGRALSIDRLMRIWRGEEGFESQRFWPWAQRMLQIQTALVYLSAFAWKSVGTDWTNGTALYYMTRLVQFQRFPMPALENGLLLRLMTWSALLAEFAVGALVWVRKLRYWILLLGVCLHLSIEYAMNIPLFQWIIMAGYVTFIDPADLSRAWAWVRRHFAARLGDPADVIYDGSSVRSVRLVNVLRATDIFERLKFIDRHSSEVRNAWPDLSDRQVQTGLLIGARGSLYEGFSALAAISRLIPLLWWLAPASLVSGPWRQPLRAIKAAK
jgi:predicted DCC family thiol-disulfide oxidoreductase YuxK